MASHSTKLPASSAHARSTTAHRIAHSKRRPSDDEILGIVTTVAHPALADASPDPAATDAGSAAPHFAAAGSASAPENSAAARDAALAQLLASHPELRDALAAARQFRAIFPTPAEALDAKNQLAELDELFFSAHPQNHAALAARIHELSPAAFHGLAHAMQAHAAKISAAHSADVSVGALLAAPAAAPQPNAHASIAHANSAPAAPSSAAHSADASVGALLAAPAAASAAEFLPASASAPQPADARRAAQLAFFHSTNAAAVQQIIASIESQVNHLLPENVSAGTKTRIVGEIYRDLDSALRSNPELVRQLREAFHAAAPDAANPHADTRAHQQAIVALVTGRARQALPSIARRVINEWTHSVVSANQERLSRHHAAAARVDISGAGPSDGLSRKPISPREVDYKRLSDSDILNL